VNILKRGAVPLYSQISAVLRHKIGEGEWRIGDRIPPEDKLCQLFDVSRSTVRQALSELVQDGLLIREPGRGTFVGNSGREVADVKMTCLLEDLIALGIPAHPLVSNIRTIEANPKVAAALELPPGEKVFSFLFVLNVEQRIFSAKRVFLPNWLGEQLTHDDLLKKKFLNVVSEKCGVQIIEADQIIEAVMADVEIAKQLEVAVGAPLLSVTQTSYTRKRVPIEHSITLYRGDRTRLSISQRQRKTKTGADDWVLTSRSTERLNEAH
jgi:GntR family transcriptional regulator